MTTPQIEWGNGTAYDLFMSLVVLHRPGDFGVRGAWAAGVRARLSPEDRDVLESSQLLWRVPLHWIYSLPEPQDATTALLALGQVPAPARVRLLALGPDLCIETKDLFEEVAQKGAWTEGDLAMLQAACQPVHEHGESKKPPTAKTLAKMLDLWAHVEEFGVQYLEALRNYQEAFFAEEEKRIRPVLQTALEHAQELAEELSLLDLLEELTQGVRLDAPPEGEELVLVPSYWSTPLVYMGMAGKERLVWLFGARPSDASLVPGEVIPETLLRALKALSDPTRLRILRDLSQETLTPAQISRRLRLRAPTVTHHLKILRLAGLVQLTLGDKELPRSYATRQEAVSAACDSLKSFLRPDVHES
ncbi:MAG: ArsR/SmtB family transcription factor [Anaerolineae bacterium]|jgi:DNA-binding transcriptional ArsR family regulator